MRDRRYAMCAFCSDEKNCRARGVNLTDDRENLPQFDQRANPSDGSSSNSNWGRAICRPADGQHLLLSTR